MAPPVPFGHYAKDHPFNPNHLLGCASCRLHALLGGHGFGHGTGCGLCGGKGCGHCSGAAPRARRCGLGLRRTRLWRRDRFRAPSQGRGPIRAHRLRPELHRIRLAAVPVVAATSQSSPVGTSVVQPSTQYPCGEAGCGISTRHSHGKGLHASLCGRCRGKGCGACGGARDARGLRRSGLRVVQGQGLPILRREGLLPLPLRTARETLLDCSIIRRSTTSWARAAPCQSLRGTFPTSMSRVAPRLLRLPAHESVRSLTLN